MAEEFVFLGNLEGYYYTGQEHTQMPLDEGSMRAEPEKYAIHLYNATITETQLLPYFNPQEHQNYKSFCLMGVPDVKVKASDKTPFKADQVFTFGSLILINPEIVNHWYSNTDFRTFSGDNVPPENRTYVHVKSSVIGVTSKSVVVNDDDKLTPDPNAPSPDGPGCFNRASGCMGQARGCMASLWKWLLWLLLLLLLWWLFRKCDDTEGRQRMCNDAEKLKREEQSRRKELDSLKNMLDKAMRDELKNISTVYFFENGTATTITSQGSSDALVSFMKKYPKTGMQLCGYMNSPPKEQNGTDKKRAQRVYADLIEGGIPRERLRVIWVGDSLQLVSPARQKDAEGNYFNRNMRVEATLFKLKNGE